MIINSEVVNGTTYYNFSARGMNYTMSFRDSLIDLMTENTKLIGPVGRTNSVSTRCLRRTDKMPKAVKNAIAIIESDTVAA